MQRALRSAEFDQSSAMRVRERDQRIRVSDQRALLAVQPEGVDSGLDGRTAAAVHETRERRAPAALKARRTTPVRDPDGAGQAEVMEVQHGAGARFASGAKRPPAEQRVHVVRVNDIRSHAPDRVRHLLGVDAAPHHRSSRVRPGEPATGAFDHLHDVAGAAQQRLQVGDRAFLAALSPISVV